MVWTDPTKTGGGDATCVILAKGVRIFPAIGGVSKEGAPQKEWVFAKQIGRETRLGVVLREPPTSGRQIWELSRWRSGSHL